MKPQVREFSFEGESIYVGLDVHKTNWKVSIMGEQLSYKTFSLDPCPDTLHSYLKKHFPGAVYYTAYEAGFSGFWIHDRLQHLGINSVVVNPSDIPTTDKEKRHKEDKRDSRKIAKNLRSGELVPIRIPSEKNRHDRSLLRIRKSIQKDLQRNKNRIKGLLLFHGIKLSDRFKQASTHWSNAFMQWLKELKLTELSGQEALRVLIENSIYLRNQLLQVTRKIRELSRSEHYAEDVQLLCTIPGIAMLTAMTWLTELESIHYYKNIDELCSYIGLVPSTNSSSDKERIGSITPRGKRLLRSMMIESAWIAVRNDAVLMRKYQQLCGRMKPNKAIIRITKKLISRIRFVLLNRKNYEILTY